jgi:hypothetical protein
MKLPVPLLLLAWATGIATVVEGGTVLGDCARFKLGLASEPCPFEAASRTA